MVLRYMFTPADWDEEFSQVGDKLVVVVFGSRSSGPYKAINPYMMQMTVDTQDDVKWLGVDMEESNDIMDNYVDEVEFIPTFWFFRHGKKLDVLDVADCDKLKEMVEKHRKPA